MSMQALEWPKEGNARVPYRVFSDPDIYKSELDRLFLGPTWQYLAMANDLPNPGDYKTTFLGETPVIVTRGEDGELHAIRSTRDMAINILRGRTHPFVHRVVVQSVIDHLARRIECLHS